MESSDWIKPVSFPKFYKSANAELKSAIQVGRLIRYGKHSVVYHGTMVGSNRSVMIKIDQRPIQRTQRTESAFQEMQAQVRRLKELNHPGIAQLIDWIPDWEHNRSYIIMQYVEGKNLNQILADKGPLSQAQTLNYAFQLLDAMAYLHYMRYVVGDLDSSNITITPENRVCLVDFRYMTDMARVLHSDEEERDEDEQTVPDIQEFPGEEDANRPKKDFFDKYDDENALQKEIREDIFYLGATLYELLTGYDPELHKSKSEREKDPPLKPLTLEQRRKCLAMNGVSESVANVILKALSPNPEERYASALEMREAFQWGFIKDSHTVSQRSSLVLGVAFTLIMLAVGLFSVYKGQYQIGRAAQMRADSTTAVAAFETGDYTGAIAKALEATRNERNDPPPPPEAQAILAEAVSAYDYIAGYKPLRSDFRLRGRPLNACFSPDGVTVAVLVEDMGAVPSAKRIQFFDARSGTELCAPLTASYSERSGFTFLDNNTLFYAGESAVAFYSLSKQEIIWEGPAGSSDRNSPVSLAVSADRKTAASICWGTFAAYLYDVGTILNNGKGGALPLCALAEYPGEDALQSAFMTADMENLLTLNADGRYLAVSFPNGGLGIYNLRDMQYYPLISESNYIHFEGGFCGGYFFYAASTTNQPMTAETYTGTQGALISLETMKTELLLSRNTPIYMQVDEDGIYLSVGDWLYRADTRYFRWEPLTQADGTIRLLRRAAGRLLVVTESGAVLIYRDDGAWKTQIAQGAFSVVGLSERYAFLASPDKTMMSALEWRENGETILSYSDDSADYYEEPYEHYGAHVCADGETAMLFRSTGFRIYDLASGYRLDGNSEETAFPREAEALICQREPTREDDPETECLKVVYADETEFYSAKTGELLLQRARMEEDAYPLFITRSFRVCQNRSGSVEIYDATSGRLLRTLFSDKLAYASEMENCLIICLVSGGKEAYSLILDKNLDVVAEVPGFCEAAPESVNIRAKSGHTGSTAVFYPDGMLIFDDMRGHLLRGPLYKLEDLRKIAIDWERE